MEVFASDTKLNISRAYLRPGFAFGGSCLPKDLRAIVYHARRADLSVPILENVISSNEAHLRRVYDRLIEGTGAPRRAARPGVQAGHRRPAREPDGRAGRAAARPRLRPQDLRRARAHLAPHGREPRLRGRAHPAPLAAHGRLADGAVFGAEVVVLASTEPESVEAAAGAQDALLVDLVRRPELAGARGRLPRRGLVSGGAWRAS